MSKTNNLRARCGATVALLALAFAAPAAGGDIKIRYPTLNIESSNPATLAQNIATAKPAKGIAYLALPKKATAPYPLVLILPHSGGVDQSVRAHAKLMRARGWATIIVDPFKPRGATKLTGKYKTGLTEMSYAHDVYRALDAVAVRTDIDMTRIAAHGVSWGGGVQIPLVSRWYKEKLGGNHNIKAHVMVSPLCWMTEREPRPTVAKVLMILGMRDEENPPVPCLAYAERLRTAGVNIEVMQQSNSAHTALGGKLQHAKALVWNNCEAQWDSHTFDFYANGAKYNLRNDYGILCIPGKRTLLKGADPAEKKRAWARIFKFIEDEFS